MATTADQLITAVLRKCYWDASDQPLTNAEILEIADEIVLGDIWPRVLESQGDYYTTSRDYPLVSGTSRYRLPASVFGPVRDVLLVSSNGTEQSIPVIDLEDLGRTAELPSTTDGFFHYLDGDFVCLYPEPTARDATYLLRVRYFRAPNRLIANANATTVSSINTSSAASAFVVTANAGSWTTASRLDVINAGNAHQALGDALRVSAIATSTTFTFTTSLVGLGIEAGDYVASNGYTPIVQAPDFMAPLLVSMVTAECLATQGDLVASQRLAARAGQQIAAVTSVKRPRNMAESRTIGGRNSPWGR